MKLFVGLKCMSTLASCKAYLALGTRWQISEEKGDRGSFTSTMYLPVPADYVMQQGSSEEESPESAATDPGTVLPRCVI